MNKDILLPEVQDFISKSLQDNVSKLALSKNPFPSIEWKEIINQIVSKNKSNNKLPTWYHTKNIYYPPSISIEQTSSEITAKYKSELLAGNSIIDLTGGFGVDCYYFSKVFKNVTHCEINTDLSKIVAHNYEKLQIDNIACVNLNSNEFLLNTTEKFDWIYIDPSRRSDSKGKVFLLKDCLPNVPENLDLYFEKSTNILIKTAPILDITAGLNEIKHIKEIHIVALDNEVKELLWILEKDYIGETNITTLNILKTKTEKNNFIFGKNNAATFELPKMFLYEPNAAILKSGCSDNLCKTLEINKLHPHSYLFTNFKLIDFPGRRFIIDQILPFKKEELKKHIYNKKMNITTRNFPLTVEELRKKYKIAEGGNVYTFFTTNINDEKIVLICTKIQ